MRASNNQLRWAWTLAAMIVAVAWAGGCKQEDAGPSPSPSAAPTTQPGEGDGSSAPSAEPGGDEDSAPGIEPGTEADAEQTPPEGGEPEATTQAADDAATQPALAAATQPGESAADTQPTTTQAEAENEKEVAEEDKEPKKIPLSFTDAGLDQIAKFLSDQLGKPVMMDDRVKEKKLTVVNPEPLLPEEAIHILTTALHEKEIAIEERDKTIHLIPIEDVAKIRLVTIGPDEDITKVEPTNKIVRKVFDIKHYDPVRMSELLKELLPKWGKMEPDPITRRLVVIATVERLVTMSRIIEEYDSVDVAGGELRSFEIKNVGVYEILPTLQKLILGYLGPDAKVEGESGGGDRYDRYGRRISEPSTPSGSIVIRAGKTSVLIIPEPRQSSIVVTAPVNVLDQIDRWLVTLDQPKPRSSEWEIVEIAFSDAGDLSSQLSDMISRIPDESLRNGVRIFPFASSRRLMIVGSEQNREIVKEWISEIDVQDTGIRVTKTFKLAHADAQEVAKNIEELFQEQQRRSYWWWDDYGSRGGQDRDKVTVSANVRQNTVTVVASPEKMAKIEEQITNEWDIPISGDDVAPLIITLKYADPETTKELLENLYVKKEREGGWRSWYYGEDEQQPSPVGRLHGQFLFEAFPDTGKLVVVSKNAQNYDVIREIIAELDSPQEAGLPKTIQLKFADAETVAEQINALLNAPGTLTQILRRGRVRGFEMFSDDLSPYSSARQSRASGPQGNEQDQAQAVMQFWWQQPPPREIQTRQPSNLVGKLRIVPNVERNMLLVAVPEEYAEAVEQLVQELDKPSYQVLIKAVIAEATLDDEMSLGYRFSTDRTLFTSGDALITEDAIRGLFEYTFTDIHANTHTFTFTSDVNNLISLLSKMTSVSIRSEPKILTADNVEGEFFDGQDIPFINEDTISEVGQRQSFDYFPVGIRLRVRPHITEEQTVNLTVQLTISSTIPGRTLFGGAIVDRRETFTQITLEHGRTFLISGILRDQETETTRKVPGLGDIPLLGEVFKHREKVNVNTEVLVFLTPYIIPPREIDPNRDPIEREPLEEFRRKFSDDKMEFGLAPQEMGPSSTEFDTARMARSIAED